MSPVLVADIGGTHIRFALAAGDRVDPATARHYACRDYAGPAEAARHYLDDAGTAPPARACLALAAPVLSRRVPMTNSDWVIDADEFETRTGVGDCRLINDFGALAWALPAIDPGDLFAIGGGRQVPGARAVLGPGTGLGVALLAERDGVRIAMPCEGGHVSFAPVDDTEIEILRHLTRVHGRVSAERLICGPGLETLHAVLGEIEGRPRERLDAKDIVAAGLADRSGDAWGTIERFCAIFGTIAGDVALVSGAVGGVYLAGGIAQRLAPVIHETPLRARFEAKGRLGFFTEAIPVWVITGEYAALTGAAAAMTARP